MRPLVVASATASLIVLSGVAGYVDSGFASERPRVRAAASVAPLSTAALDALTSVVQTRCAECHNDDKMKGDLSLEHFDVAAASKHAAVSEKIIAKLRAGMMPPPGTKPPGGDTLVMLASTLERIVDVAAAANPNPGWRSFQRLNRAEYSQSVKALLGLDVDAGSARHQKRELRQHRRRPAPLGDDARRVPRRRDRSEPSRDRRSVGGARVDHVQDPAPRLAARPRSRRADRHARRRQRDSQLPRGR
jgi:hypothetical protein